MNSVEAVPRNVRKLLDKLALAGIFKDFYLAGGTGLAFLLSHRQSVDLDFFSSKNRLRAEERRLLIAQLKPAAQWVVTEEKDGTLHGRLGRVRASFFWYPYPCVKPLLRRDSLRIASMEDIALMKIGAIIGRGSRKDFVDLYEICRKIPLEEVFRLGQKKFKHSRDFTLQALKALCFFEDAEAEPPVLSVKPTSWPQVREFFARKSRILAQRYLSSQCQCHGSKAESPPRGYER